MRTPVSLAIVGLGSWGASIARVLEELPQAELRYVYDTNPRTELRLRALLGPAAVASSLDEILYDEAVDAVILGVPSSRSSELARAVLAADKHLLLRPPLALRSDDAAELVELASARQRWLALAYRYRFSPAVRRLRELLDEGQLGELYYLDIAHHDPGSRATARNVLWGLGHEQVAVVSYLLGDEPVEVAAHGESYAEPGIVDVAYLSLRFATGISAHMHLSWLGPQASARLTAVGADRTVVLDGHALQIHHGDGELVMPRLPDDEPLRLGCSHFLALVQARGYDAVEAREAVRLIGVLEALQGSLESGGSVERSEPKPETAVVALPSR